MTRASIRLLLLTVLAAVLSVVAAAPASAKAPCWKQLINDWYDGRIDGSYALHCYEEAIDHLPADVDQYSSAAEDIRRALQKRIADEKASKAKGNKGGGNKGGGTVTPPPTKSGGKGGKGNGKPSGGTGTQTTPTQTTPTKTTPTKTTPTTTTPTRTTSPGRRSDGGPVGDTLRKIGPKDADSIPIPLLVLGGIAMILLAAGSAGLIARRIQGRRVQIRPGESTPPKP